MRSVIATLAIIASLTIHAAKPKDESAPSSKPTLEAQMGFPFQDNAVLQQKMKLPVWGTSLPEAKVSVVFDGQTKTVTADKDGKWRLTLDPMDAVILKSVTDVPSGKVMTVTCEKDGTSAITTITNLVLGEVWFAAGQSNMAGAMKTIFIKEKGPDGKTITTDKLKPIKFTHYPMEIVSKANYPGLRQLASPNSTWEICTPRTLKVFKKVCFFFLHKIYHELNVPVGIIHAAVGGSKIETWLTQKPYELGGNHSKLVVPMVGYGIRGALWYQGESNAKDGRGYEPKLKSLITGWRKIWGQGEFPVYYVQLPGIGKSPTDNPAMGDGRAEIRQAYFKTLELKNTGMAVCLDIGDVREHPPNKFDTGRRLAHEALRQTYGIKTIPISPLYKSHKLEGSTIRVSFTNADSGLMVAAKDAIQTPKPVDGKLAWLSIQAKDGTWHWAEGTIDGSDLVVSSKDVKEPVAVRYAYTNHPTPPLLYSTDGMPVGPFSTIGYGPEQTADPASRKPPKKEKKK